MIEPGIERSDEFVVEDRLITDVGGTIGVSVLSTPGMIGMMERNSAVLAYEHLPDGKATVGFEVCVKHVAAAAEGATCRVRSRPGSRVGSAGRPVASTTSPIAGSVGLYSGSELTPCRGRRRLPVSRR